MSDVSFLLPILYYHVGLTSLHIRCATGRRLIMLEAIFLFSKDHEGALIAFQTAQSIKHRFILTLPGSLLQARRAPPPFSMPSADQHLDYQGLRGDSPAFVLAWKWNGTGDARVGKDQKKKTSLVTLFIFDLFVNTTLYTSLFSHSMTRG